MTPPKLSAALSLIVVVLVCCGPTQAQQDKSSESLPAPDAALRAKAFDLLESLASQISTLQSAENRARLGSNIAASLWEHNEKRARSLLVSVEAEIKTELQKTDEDEIAEAQTRMIFLKLRMDTVERIAKHDVELALAFLKATELRADKPQSYEVTEMERSVELRLAKQVAAESPDVALKLGRQSLARGFPNDLLSLLTQLNRKHRGQGLILYKEIVAKLRDVGLAPDSEASYFAGSLAYSFKPPAADAATYRELISLLITTALENGCGKELGEDDERADACDQIGPIWPLMKKIDPLRAAQLKHWALENQWDSTMEGPTN